MSILLIFALVFLPVGWFIWRMLRFTAQTVGNESPLYTTVVRQYSFLQYFTRINTIFGVIFAVQGLMLLSLLPNTRWPNEQPWLAVSIMLLIILLLLGLAFFLVWLDWHYWFITGGKIVTYEPEQRTIYVERNGETIALNQKTILEIENHKAAPNAGQMVRGYGYYFFRLKNGQNVTLSEHFFSWPEIMGHYFAGVSTKTFYYKIPLIKARHISS